MKPLISNRDLWPVQQYLDRKLMAGLNYLDDDEIQFNGVRSYKLAKSDNMTLSDWCIKWLNKDQLRQLGNALRAQRYRTKQKKGSGIKTVTLSHQAWLILSTCAKRDGVTISEYVIKRLEDEWLQVGSEQEELMNKTI